MDTYWMKFYKSEQELVNDLREIDVQQYNEFCSRNICSGFQYITRSVRTLQSGQSLSDAQMRMVKRLAKQVYKYHENMQKV